MINAKFLSLNAQDAIKGAIVAAGTSIITTLVSAMNTGSLPHLSDLRGIGIAGLSAGLAYLLKNFLTNSKDQLGKPEPK
ncbi:MAG TPA: hypothetical protein VIJ25_08270 [Methylococcales bacterium]